jgi:hypothetical protein
MAQHVQVHLHVSKLMHGAPCAPLVVRRPRPCRLRIPYPLHLPSSEEALLDEGVVLALPRVPLNARRIRALLLHGVQSLQRHGRQDRADGGKGIKTGQLVEKASRQGRTRDCDCMGGAPSFNTVETACLGPAP